VVAGEGAVVVVWWSTVVGVATVVAGNVGNGIKPGITGPPADAGWKDVASTTEVVTARRRPVVTTARPPVPVW
jgi:hypothetical protein